MTRKFVFKMFAFFMRSVMVPEVDVYDESAAIFDDFLQVLQTLHTNRQTDRQTYRHYESLNRINRLIFTKRTDKLQQIICNIKTMKESESYSNCKKKRNWIICRERAK